jgi:hypothetical protein
VLFTAADCGVEDPRDRAWVDSLMTAHPLRAFADPVSLTGRVREIPRKTYVRCSRFDVAFADATVSKFERADDYRTERWDIGHDAMIASPDRVADVIAGAAAG